MHLSSLLSIKVRHKGTGAVYTLCGMHSGGQKVRDHGDNGSERVKYRYESRITSIGLIDSNANAFGVSGEALNEYEVIEFPE